MNIGLDWSAEYRVGLTNYDRTHWLHFQAVHACPPDVQVIDAEWHTDQASPGPPSGVDRNVYARLAMSNEGWQVTCRQEMMECD
jgi:hypothetical protein